MRTALFAVLVALAACEAPDPVVFDLQEEAAVIRTNCLNYGFTPGTDSYRNCLVLGAESADLRRERAMRVIYEAGGSCAVQDDRVICGF